MTEDEHGDRVAVELFRIAQPGRRVLHPEDKKSLSLEEIARRGAEMLRSTSSP